MRRVVRGRRAQQRGEEGRIMVKKQEKEKEVKLECVTTNKKWMLVGPNIGHQRISTHN